MSLLPLLVPLPLLLPLLVLVLLLLLLPPLLLLLLPPPLPLLLLLLPLLRCVFLLARSSPQDVQDEDHRLLRHEDFGAQAQHRTRIGRDQGGRAARKPGHDPKARGSRQANLLASLFLFCRADPLGD